MTLDSLERVVYVAPWGADASGAGFAEDNPLRTLQGARDVIRLHRASHGATAMELPMTVQLSSGVHHVEEALALDVEDSYVTWQGQESDTVISGGWRVPSSCWVATGLAHTFKCALDDTELTDAQLANIRVARLGNQVQEPARFPRPTTFEPYTSGFLFVADYSYVNGTFFIAVADEDRELPMWMKKPDFKAKVKYWPKESWNNVRATIRATSSKERETLCANYSTWFAIPCPVTYDEACDGYDGKIEDGSRFYVMNHMEALYAGGWIYKEDTKEVMVNASGLGAKWREQVSLAVQNLLMDIHGVTLFDAAESYVRNVSLKALRFTDTTYESYGFQSGFNVYADSAGIPNDAAVHVIAAADITIEDCVFRDTGGGGVLVTGTSFAVTISGCSFMNMGQSGVILTGNATTQPSQVVATKNTMVGIGLFLASAGGIYASSASWCVFSSNRIEQSARWGIAVRSEEAGNSTSYHNLLEFNTVKKVGQQSKDFGGLSFIGYDGVPDVETIVRFNCVRETIGVYSKVSNGVPSMEYPYLSYGIYLDNEASGFTVTGNVVDKTVESSLFIHLGKDNIVHNNILAFSSNEWDSGGQIEMKGNSDWSRNNSFTRNIVIYRQTETRALLDSSNFERKYFEPIDWNIYYCTNSTFEKEFLQNDDLTPEGNWSMWRSYGYDADSLVTDPLFVDALRGDFRLRRESPAYRLGFRALPDEIAVCD